VRDALGGNTGCVFTGLGAYGTVSKLFALKHFETVLKQTKSLIQKTNHLKCFNVSLFHQIHLYRKSFSLTKHFLSPVWM